MSRPLVRIKEKRLAGPIGGMADAEVLKTSAARRKGSSPLLGTMLTYSIFSNKG